MIANMSTDFMVIPPTRKPGDLHAVADFARLAIVIAP
jgi:hypothetical protein